MTGLVDPRTLSARQRRALRLMVQRQLYRARNGYGAVPDKVSLDVAASLMALGLAKVDATGRHPRLAPTFNGRNVVGIMELRSPRPGLAS